MEYGFPIRAIDWVRALREGGGVGERFLNGIGGFDGV